MDARSRRRLLAAASGTITAGVVAGCLSGSEEADEPEPVVDEALALEGTTDPAAWADVSAIHFDGWVGGWVGIAPEAIYRVENPALVLQEGRSYEFTWVNRDGIHHNLAFWDADREVVRDYSTPGTDVEGATETLTVEAATEMATYRCEYQPAGQVGEVRVVPNAADE